MSISTKIPDRESNSSIYESILITNSWKKHSSWYAIMYIIGLDKDDKPIEKARAWDDINRVIPPHKVDSFEIPFTKIQTDWMIGWDIRFHSSLFRFHVGMSMSSTTITLLPRHKNETH